MANLFDLNTHVGGNRLLTEKPHHEGSLVSGNRSNVLRSYVVDEHMQTVSELGKSPSYRKPNGTPIKMLMAQEMSKEEVSKKGPPSLVAKLMGLDDLPHHAPLSSPSCRTNRSRSRSQSGSLDFIQKGHNGKCKESKNEKNMSLIREKFMEAKRLSVDEKLCQSKQFQDALEVLNSNKDLFLKYLQEPNSLFSQHHKLPSIPPRPDSKRITILKPSKFVDNRKLPQDKFSENHYQPTHIVVLKPKCGILNETRAVSSSPSSKTLNDDGFYADFEDNEPEESSSSHRRDETLLSSVLSNGYNGDESSFGKSEVYYAAENLSDSEVMTPTARNSWDYHHDYIDRFGSPYSSSLFSRASCSLDSSVCREAKKRLSERWAMMSLNRSGQEQRHVRRNSSTLGEMLALSDCKNTSDLNKNKGHDIDVGADGSSQNLVRSKSLPVSSTEFLKGKKDDDTKDLTMEKSQRNRKSNKQKSQMPDDEVHQSSGNIGNECINGIVVKDIGQQLTENLWDFKGVGIKIPWHDVFTLLELEF
ncbi:uncharacterized protein LOC143558195 [Bidens hawaiensis]|uniref:uncharacterized protein LOC143558195 n=1 Tax=Bidens hawaiensis TaxID=980011 RepID=UPI0040494E43